MVAYGYILPKKNIDTRLETLQEGLKNQNIKNLNSKSNLNLYSPLTITSAVPTITQQTGQPQQMPPSSAQPTTIRPTVGVAINPQELEKYIIQRASGKEDELRVPQFVPNSNVSASLPEILQKIIDRQTEKLKTVFDTLKKSAKDAKKRKFEETRMIFEKQKLDKMTKEARDYLKNYYDELNVPLYDRINIDTSDLEAINKEIADLYNMYDGSENDDFSDISDEIPPLLEEPPPSTVMPPPSNTAQTGLTWTSSEDTNFSNLNPLAQQAILFVENFKNPNLSYDQFKNIIKDNSKKIELNLSSDRRKNTYYRIPTSQRKIQTTQIQTKGLNKAYNYYKENPAQFYSQIETANKNEFSALFASGLKSGKVKSPYYSNYEPNFGKLHLMENSLKKNQLTIYRPFSKITVASKTGISPLLKKMILDIQNTLEFEQKDYENLEGDEKRIIEIIIRSQKDMKNYNIQALIDQDDYKTKKRLEILVGQVNAGNNSKLIREEMKALLKKLYDNKAISLPKYRNSLNAIKALE